jgi:dolichol-phosphate mannosyltransferase
MAITDLPHVQGNDNRARPLWYHSSGVAGTHVAHGPELSIIVPAFNERENIAPLVEQVAAALPDVQWELIFVDDDSRDGTAAAVRRLAQSDARVRCIQRVGRRGLSTAVIEGMLASSAPVLAVMDADLQHDPALLPAMFARLHSDDIDIVIGSRYVTGGNIGDWDGTRAAGSTLATKLARMVVTADLADPMSGYFMLTRPAFESTMRRLSGQGFKILLDLFASAPQPLRFAELPLTFRSRLHGESKMDSGVVWDYVSLLLGKSIGMYIPLRFVMFTIVGTLGIVVHLVMLRTLLSVFAFGISQAIATTVAMTSNFALNNVLTYRDRRLRGVKLIVGLLSFCAVCSVGAVANVGIAATVFERHYSWWMSGLAGAAIGAVWNYSVSSIFTWRRNK